jgi:disulfide bond formation protein DsbB
MDMMSVETHNYLLALGTIVMQVVTIGFLVVYLLQSKYPGLRDILSPFEKWGMHIGFLLSLLGLVMTLYYSEVLGFEPCFLCWWQRICLYPQILLFGLALWKKELRDSAALYSIWLSAIGILFALYHHVDQVFPQGNLPCSAQGPSCAKITFIEFGYVTFPMMSLSLFALMIVLMLITRTKRA